MAEELIPLTDEELEMSMCVILAAYGRHFPVLKGKAVGPHERDGKRQAFAREMVARLRASQIVFFKRVSDHPLMLDTGCFGDHKC